MKNIIIACFILFFNIGHSQSSNNAFNFVGNPFHAAINMGPVLNTATNLTQFMYVWDPTLGATGAYVTVNTANNTNNNASSQANRNLQPYQAVFIQTGTQGVAPVLTITENDKVVTETQTNIFRVNNEDIDSEFAIFKMYLLEIHTLMWF
ncbi:MAG: hypothetical protein ACOVLC_07185 [Flavobacterium sp.]